MALYQYITGHSNFAGRAHATFVNPNSFSGYLLLTIPVMTGLYLASQIKQYVVLFFILNILCFAALLATGTGGRWIFLAAAVAVALILFWIFVPVHSSPIPPLAKSPSFPPFSKGDEGGLKGGKGGFEKGRNVKTRLIVLFLGFLAALFIFFLPVGNGNVAFSPKPVELSGSTMDRLNIWKSTWEVIKEHPVRGVGFWSFHTIYSKYKNQIYKNVEHYFSHNDYLQLWAELGLIGAGVFLLLILFYFREGLRCLKVLPLPPPEGDKRIVPLWRGQGEDAPTHRTMLLSTLIGSFLLLVHTIGDFDLYIPSILFLLWGYMAYTSSTATELGLCKTKVIDLNSFRIFTMLGKKKLYIITAGIFAFLCFWVSDPYLAGLYNERGKGYLAIGEYEKAVKFFSKAVELDSIDDSYHFNFGLALAKSSNDPLILTRAEDEMKKAIAIAPYRSDIYFNLANFYREFYLKEKGNIAVAMMKKARELDPLDATISHNFGVLYMQLGMYKGAIDEFKRYLEEEPNDVDAHIEMSGAYRMNKEYDNALKEIDWLLNKNTNNNYAHFLKANILADMGRYDAAYAEYQLALREKGKEADVWYAIGLLSLKQNKPKEAKEAFKKAAEYKLLLNRTKKKG
jgi:O-antigen ligase/Tfp pilus assembly protein PilF